MFTGIVTGVGQIVAVHALGESNAHGKRIRIACPPGYLADVGLGDSIALNGACMTVVAFDASQNLCDFDVSAESLNKTTGLDTAHAVNLEKALRAHDRLGGHIVTGHVDGKGLVTHFAQVGESWELRVQAPPELKRFLARKGSVTINGVSLTVNEVIDLVAPPGHTQVSVNIIPHTHANTSLGSLQCNDLVNLEIDLMARYVERMLAVSVEKDS